MNKINNGTAFNRRDDNFNIENLFDDENDGAELPEDESKAVIKDFFSNSQNEFRSSFEDLHSEAHDKYMVPLFSDEVLVGFRGNGVIVGQYLITAAHVAQTEPDELGRTTNLPALYFPFEGERLKVTDDNRVYDGRGYHLHDANLDDVIVYELADIYGTFELNDAPLLELLEMANLWYLRDTDSGMVIRPHKHLCKVVSLEAVSVSHQVWKNCFTIQNQWQLFNGNSGGAVFRNNKVYGIISRANSFRGIVIDSRYIQQCINEKTSSL